MSSYKKIIPYIENLKTNYSLYVTVKDYSGFIYKNETLERLLRPYLAHSSPYCMFIKETEKGYQKCLAQNIPLYEKCKERKTFTGYCPAGICELVVPIANKDQVFGSINVSHFTSEEDKGNYKREQLMKDEPDKRKLTARLLYRQFVRPSTIEISSVQFSLELLADFIVEILNNSKGPVENSSKDFSDEKKIRAYITENTNDKILAEQVVSSLKISKTTLKTCIEGSNAKNFREYVNMIRLEQSEKLLVETEKTPKDIALTLGFKDYNHFCRLFREKTKISPSDYQKYYKNEKHLGTD
ncbi:MAG: helix-turn-helix domain-containing protein [Sphaerochaeta sp.]|nr:helix-turn-helix domain-containing protein [Sphaerochaeta sp.]